MLATPELRLPTPLQPATSTATDECLAESKPSWVEGVHEEAGRVEERPSADCIGRSSS